MYDAYAHQVLDNQLRLCDNLETGPNCSPTWTTVGAFFKSLKKTILKRALFCNRKPALKFFGHSCCHLPWVRMTYFEAKKTNNVLAK